MLRYVFWITYQKTALSGCPLAANVKSIFQLFISEQPSYFFLEVVNLSFPLVKSNQSRPVVFIQFL